MYYIRIFTWLYIYIYIEIHKNMNMLRLYRYWHELHMIWHCTSLPCFLLPSQDLVLPCLQQLLSSQGHTPPAESGHEAAGKFMSLCRCFPNCAWSGDDGSASLVTPHLGWKASTETWLWPLTVDASKFVRMAESIPPSAVSGLGSLLIVSGQGFPMMMSRGSDVGLREILGLWRQLKCAKLTVNSQLFGHPKMNISSRELVSTSVVSRLLQTVVPNGHGGVLNLFNVQHLGAIFNQRWTTTTRSFPTCNELPGCQSFNLTHLFCLENLPWNIQSFCQWISPGGRFRHLGILFTSLDAGS